jgi:hypothetical protein
MNKFMTISDINTFNNACIKWSFSKDQIYDFEQNLITRCITNHFNKGMPLNITKSFLKHDILFLYNFGKLD